MRLLKSTIKNTFPNFTDVALASTQAQLDAAVNGTVLGTAAARFFAGTAALPGLTPAGDPDTGIFAPAANQIGISVGGVQLVSLSSASVIVAGGIAGAAVASVGAFSGGTGQLVPIGSTLLWWDDVLPAEGGYAWANGQIIASANTVCPVLLARWGSRFGGNGTTTMGVPDLRDTVPVGKSTMGGVASRALQTLTNTVLGTLLGLANNVLLAVNLPPYTPAGTITNGAISTGVVDVTSAATGASTAFTTGPVSGTADMTAHLRPTQATSTFTGTVSSGTSTPVNNVQPSTTCNYILRLA